MRQLPLLFAPSADVQTDAMHPAETQGHPAAQPVTNLRTLPASTPDVFTLSPLGLALATLGALAGAYHGTRRNRGSVGWGLAWGLAGATAPIITTGIAVAQGYGRPQEKK